MTKKMQMQPSLQKPSPGFASKTAASRRRVSTPSRPERHEDLALLHVVEALRALFRALPESNIQAREVNWSDRVIGAVVLAFVEGELKRGDPFPGPDQLARICDIPLTDALNAIAFLMQQRLLQQDARGALHIHATAMPTLDMKHRALLLRAQQLVRQAHEWQLSDDGLRSLFDRAARETA